MILREFMVDCLPASLLVSRPGFGHADNQPWIPFLTDELFISYIYSYNKQHLFSNALLLSLGPPCLF